MISKKVIVKQANGLHLKPAGVLCNLTNKFDSSIILKNDHKEVNAKSIISVLGSRVKSGEEIEIICNGVDEEKALEAITKLFDTPFGELN
ncbi:MAG: HPr family phosphocarrier protein [Eubacterium sp.]